MREIKFRAWDERNKVMHNNFQFIRSGTKDSDWIIFISDRFTLDNHETNPFKNPSPYATQQLKVMQYTGIKDKDGKEIYEGDILEFGGWGFCDYIGGYLGTIIHVTTLPDLYLKKYELEEQSSFGFEHKIKIIGNEYENPELLEVEG